MAEQNALNQVLGNGTAIDGHKRGSGAFTFTLD